MASAHHVSLEQAPRPRRIDRPTYRLLLVTGFLGGYTTFSTFEWEVFALGRSVPPLALLYGVSSVVLGWMACWVGASMGRRA